MKAETGGSGDFKQPKPGVTIGRCYSIIDLGTQVTTYGPKRQILMSVELPLQTEEFEGVVKPMMASKKYTLSFNKKAILRKDMESWYGKKFNDKDIENSGGFDPSKILGRTGQVLLEENDTGDKVYINIGAIMPLAEGQTCPDQFNDSFFFDLDDFSIDKWESMSENMRSWISKSPEAKQALQQGQGQQEQPAPIDDGFDDIPF